MNYIVFDLEATCWGSPQEAQGRSQEIIEIGALKFDEHGEEQGRFEAFIRPVVHPTLSQFCKDLTSISQVNVNQARPFVEVLPQFQEWIGLEDEEEYLLCSWGFFDKKVFAKNCLLHEFDPDWTKSHISLKHQYPRLKGIRTTIGLNSALKKEGFEFEGTQHRGIDDAINLAKIFCRYLTQWHY